MEPSSTSAHIDPERYPNLHRIGHMLQSSIDRFHLTNKFTGSIRDDDPLSYHFPSLEELDSYCRLNSDRFCTLANTLEQFGRIDAFWPALFPVPLFLRHRGHLYRLNFRSKQANEDDSDAPLITVSTCRYDLLRLVRDPAYN